ncbi:TetR/AcrR family transcriptional regulator [Dactylosporangium aurantiacum]|uniref:TetR/AcrR family transcriptional regulator n=1 Tax=Dactylosporangium aurantiacum TaxID=35754 RepID=A0A9Q9IMP4_9ACTN|nr:TetR family transcriptional regulator [Dactylosporangium aurantiacum]MDG6109148.1 TetR family transcriptional regulator [Dactylosporangium aurantiacum]UWZ58476.1 TetR/AcrR family transcriptional regulator [Dactylosporangium aurantiacum]
MTGKARRARSDGLANRDRIIATAARMFAEQGVDVPLDEIAAAAQVGSATLHRHFTGRLDLVHCVLDVEAERLAAGAGELASPADPAGALVEWLHRLIAFTASFRGLAVLLGAHQADTTLEARHRALYAAAQLLLDDCRAQRAVDPDVTVSDLLKLTNAISIASAESPETAHRLLNIMVNGLRTDACAGPPDRAGR